MALNIPNTDTPGNAFLKGSEAGSTMFSRLMNAKQGNMLRPSGDVANALYVEQLKRQFGEQDPRYLEAKKAHDMILSGRESLINYRDVLNQTAGIRATSPLGKLLAEGRGEGGLDIVGNNKSAPSGSKYKVGEQYYNEQGEPVYGKKTLTSDEKKAYEQAIAKDTTDAAIRNKIPYAENVKITLDSINPDDLVQFSGPKGTINLGIESLKAAFGAPSENYLAYQKSLTSAQTLKKQLRQFWGDSIQPAATEEIGKLTNPSHWNKNPEVAKQQFEQLKKITEQELASFTSHGTSPVKLDYNKKTGEFFASEGDKKSSLQEKIESSSNKKSSVSEEDKKYAEAAAQQFKDVLPKATARNILETAKQTGKSVADVIDHLTTQAQIRRGIQNG